MLRQKEAAKELQLLDNDAMRVLSMFAKSAQQPPPAPTNQSNDQKRRSAGFAADVTNRARPASAAHAAVTVPCLLCAHMWQTGEA